MNFSNIVKRIFSKSSRRLPTGWHPYVTEREATEYLCERARRLTTIEKNIVIIIGEESSAACEYMIRELSRELNSVYCVNIDGLSKVLRFDVREVACFVCGYFDSRSITRAARFITDHETISNIRFEYIPVHSLDFETFLKRDLVLYEDISFVSPLLIYDVDVFHLYEESLQKFQQKCQIRDFMDLSQLIKSVVENNIEGDVAEFGSFEGHSGYLISRLLSALGSKKRVYLFDTFEGFPPEEHGIDKMWNNTHLMKRSFDDIQASFAGADNVSLIRGDFTKTFDSALLNHLSLVYVDCDSYRGTKYLIERIYLDVLSPGGVMVFEDYGHSMLLGNRLAVHDYFDRVTGCMKYFSQFSGFYIVVKL